MTEKNPAAREDAEDTTVPQDSAAQPAADGGGKAAKSSESEKSERKHSNKELLARLAEKNETIFELSSENDRLAAQLKETTDRYLRTAADFENYRKRSRKEWDLLKQQTKADIILDVLNVADDFERAFSVAEESDRDEFVQGIRLIYNNLTQVLDKLGVVEIEAQDQPFDPNLHMAVGQIESDTVDSGTVIEVVQKGYRLDDAVVRPARVIVAK